MCFIFMKPQPFCLRLLSQNKIKLRKFSTMDILVPITMKSAAKCDKQCELQNSANHQILERNWR